MSKLWSSGFATRLGENVPHINHLDNVNPEIPLRPAINLAVHMQLICGFYQLLHLPHPISTTSIRMPELIRKVAHRSSRSRLGDAVNFIQRPSRTTKLPLHMAIRRAPLLSWCWDSSS
jgi:hypothetical protein